MSIQDRGAETPGAVEEAEQGITEKLLANALESAYALAQRCNILEETVSTLAYALRVEPWRGIEEDEDFDRLLKRIKELMNVLGTKEAAQARPPEPQHQDPNRKDLR